MSGLFGSYHANPFSVFAQVIRCLLIVPNPASALNEEAGKLLLEHYDDYARRFLLFPCSILLPLLHSILLVSGC